MAIVVEIVGGKTVPPPPHRGQAHGCRDIAQSGAVVVIKLQRHPFPRRHQVQSPVAVDVDPHRGGDHPSGVNELRGDGLRDIREVTPVIP